MFGAINERTMKRVMNQVDVREMEQIRGFAQLWARIEADQIEAASELADAHGFTFEHETTEEERVEQILDVIEAVKEQDVKGHYFREVAPDRLADPESAMQHAGIDSEEWADLQAKWVESWRRTAGEQVADKSDREVVALHVENVYGLGLDEFEREVIGYDRGEALERILAANFYNVRDVMQNATKAADEWGESA